MESGLVTQADIVRKIEMGGESQRGGAGADALEGTPAYWYERDYLTPIDRRVDGRRVVWRLDRIRYSGLTFPDGSPCRSTGHWNRPDQLEYFMVVEGEVMMEVAEPDGASARVAVDAASTVDIPPGAWHVTYAQRPALVDNIYCYIGSHDCRDEEEKYRRRRPDTSNSPTVATNTAGMLNIKLPTTGLLGLFSDPCDPGWNELDSRVRLMARDGSW